MNVIELPPVWLLGQMDPNSIDVIETCRGWLQICEMNQNADYTNEGKQKKFQPPKKYF